MLGFQPFFLNFADEMSNDGPYKLQDDPEPLFRVCKKEKEQR